MKLKWNKITEVMPEDGKDYLVWTGSYMVVSMAHVYDDEHKKHLNEVAETHEKMGGENNLAIAKMLRTATGKFADFGLHWYFDNPKVYWAELPEGPV